MPAIALTVLSGSSISSCFALSPMGRPWALFVPSMSGNTIRCDFTHVALPTISETNFPYAPTLPLRSHHTGPCRA